MKGEMVDSAGAGKKYAPAPPGRIWRAAAQLSRKASAMAAHAQIGAFVAQCTPEIATQLRRARADLRKLIPKGYELVYDSHNALVFAFGPTARASELVISIAGCPNWVTLFFARGTALEVSLPRFSGPLSC